VALSEIDRTLLERCLARKPRAWEDFVDRFMGLVVHVANHTAQARSIRLASQDRDDLCAEVFLEIVKDDCALLRRFRSQSSLATYLTVVARRVVVAALLEGRANARPAVAAAFAATAVGRDSSDEQRLSDREEVQRLLDSLDGPDADIVRMYHLEGKSYREISASVGMPENSIGPTLSRARQKLRRAGADTPTA
jgi:RNA polymerase sigma-70 factor, ECF subfamily